MIIPKRPKNLSKNKKIYFTQETEDAIVLYNNNDDPIFRSKIYQEKIYYSFYKLTENIIHTFKFYNTEVENLNDLQQELLVFLLDKLHLFDPSRGTKAYSYFGTAVKRWLILHDQKNYKKKIDKVNIEDFDNKNYEEVDSKYNDKLSFFIEKYIEYCTENIYELFPKEEDAKIADAILELFRKRDQLEIFNKKALYINIREMINVKTPKITAIADQLYEIFKKNYINYLDNNQIKF